VGRTQEQVQPALRVLVVCHRYRADGDVFRIISARRRIDTSKRTTREVDTMKKRYDFSKARPNPYAKRLKKAVTIRLDQEALEYFQRLAEETGIPYQTLINLDLRDCATTKKKLRMHWKPQTEKGAA
jgi:uncharacterized protein (DUF4415 family)